MTQQSIPASPTYRYVRYTDLHGIDLTSDVTQVTRNRAADILNMLPDTDTGNPRKRVGWRTLYDFSSGTNFLGSRHIPEWGVDIIATNIGVFAHDSSSSSWDAADVDEIISTNVTTWDSVAFIGFDANAQYLINIYDKRYALTYSNSTVTATALTNSYIPHTIISRNPDGTDGYAYEAVNAFTPHRQITFLSNYTADAYDATATYEVGDLCLYNDVLYKCTSAITAAEAWTASHWTAVAIEYYFYPSADRDNHTVAEIVSVEARDSNGEWQTIQYTPITTGGTITAYDSQDKDTIETYQPVIGFTLSARHEPVVSGQDDIRVEIVEFSGEQDDNNIYLGYYSPIVGAILENNVAARYGMTSMDREFFVADNGRIYYTDANNYDYLPDNNYIQIQVDAPIVGFHRKNTYLVAVTGSSAEFTIFMITGATTTLTHRVYTESGTTEEETEDYTYFIAKTALAGTGAISRKSFATLVDDTLFLSRMGIYGITSNNVTSTTVLANRSEFINPRLTEESEMGEAAAGVWQGMYLLSFPNTGHVYVLDSRQTHQNRGVSYGYECYYLTGIYATDFLSYEGNLFFGDTSGRWCRLNTDISDYTAYQDGGAFDADGVLSGGTAIDAYYAFKMDSDDYPHYFKTLNKRGTAVEFMQLAASGAKIYYSKDGQDRTLISSVIFAGKFVWTLVDFEMFSFNSAGGIRTAYPKKKMKKYKYLQFILESDTINQDFGICGITKTYYLGNFAKG